MKTTPTGIELITQERERQVSKEGWTAEHDDKENLLGELTEAAIVYAMVGSACIRGSSAEEWPYDTVSDPYTGLISHWPWSEEWWKPSDDPIRNLVKAGALIAAEIDRLQRAAKSP